MSKQKIKSTLLSLIVALSILISCGGTVLADPVDPQQNRQILKMLPVLLMPLILPIRVMPKIKLAQKIRLMKKIRPVRKIPKRPQNRLSLQRSAAQKEAVPVLNSETVYTGLSPAVVTLLSPVRVQCLIIRAPAALPGLI